MTRHSLAGKLVGVAGIFLSCVPATATAQQETTSGRLNAPAAAGRSQATVSDTPITPRDRGLLIPFIRFNKDEISLAQLAQRRALSAGVKAFAGTIIEDQTGVLNLLEAIPGASARPAGTSVRKRQNPDDLREFMRLIEEIDRDFHRSVARDLSQKKGRSFDTEFIYWQILAHLRIIDSLTIAERDVSARLKPILQQWIQVAQYHLIRGEELAMRIDMPAAGAAAGGIFGPASKGTAGSVSGTRSVRPARVGISPLPTTSQSPRGANGGSP